jgi:hypothetical protein
MGGLIDVKKSGSKCQGVEVSRGIMRSEGFEYQLRILVLLFAGSEDWGR